MPLNQETLPLSSDNTAAETKTIVINGPDETVSTEVPVRIGDHNDMRINRARVLRAAADSGILVMNKTVMQDVQRATAGEKTFHINPN